MKQSKQKHLGLEQKAYNRLKRERDIMERALLEIITTARSMLGNVLMVGNRPVKNTSRKDAYKTLEELQEFFRTNTTCSDWSFLQRFLYDTEKKPVMKVEYYDKWHPICADSKEQAELSAKILMENLKQDLSKQGRILSASYEVHINPSAPGWVLCPGIEILMEAK